jgi:hypothetical protein
LDDQQALDWTAKENANPDELLNIDAFLMEKLQIKPELSPVLL